MLALAIGLPIVLLTLGRLTTPDPRGFGTHEQLGLPACPMRRVLGVPCPACGATTALALLARGRVAESATLHPLACFLALLTPLVGLLALFEHLRGGDLAKRLARLPRRLVFLAGLILLALAWAWNLARAF